MSARNQGSYRCASRLALWTSILFVAHAVTAVATSLLNTYQLALIDVFRFGGTIPLTLSRSQDARQRALTAFEIGVTLGATILFLVWVYRVSQNSRTLGAEGMQYTPSWSVGWFFVPVVGLVMPYNVFRELWKANSSNAAGKWQQAPVSRILGIWWLAWVANVVIQYSPLQVAIGRHQIGALVNQPHEQAIWAANNIYHQFFCGRLLSDVVGIAASVLTVVVVVRLTDLQKRWHAAVNEPQLQQDPATV